jgi:beta-glucosidase
MTSRSRSLPTCAGLLAGLVATGCAMPSAQTPRPVVQSRVKPLLAVDGLTFRDLNGNGTLDPYEDWRRQASARIDDLVARMTPAEKAGMMLIQTLNADAGGALPDNATRLVRDEHMTRFIFRNAVVTTPVEGAGQFQGRQVTPAQAAEFTNAVQALAEGTRLGIPVVFKSNARNHYEQDARPGINVAAGALSVWPKEAGLAATRDMRLVEAFGDAVREEWTALGLRSIYGYMADLATEPRWYRVHETFTESADLAADIIGTLVRTLQGPALGPGRIATTIKHFPGGGPQENGGDPHYYFGRHQTYPTDGFAYHLKPFRAAIDAGASAIMPYYGIPIGQPFEQNDVGMSFSRGIVTTLLRERLGFRGYVNSDTGIIGPPGASRSWGLEGASVEDQLAAAIAAGVDVLSGFSQHAQILGLVESGRVSQDRVDDSVRRLLREQFALGLFENPYVDPTAATATVGRADLIAQGLEAQRRSIVLLENTDARLPLAASSADAPVRVYTMGVDASAVASAGYAVTAGDHDADTPRPAVPAGTRYALIRVTVTNPTLPLDRTAHPREPSPVPGREPSTFFGGALPDQLHLLSFSDMARARSWRVTPSLDDIQAVMQEVGAANTVLAIYFRQPYVLDEASRLRTAGAIVALFGASDAALMDVLTGRHAPTGRLPFALARSADAIVRQASDAPGYDDADTLYPFGFGLGY